MKRLLLAAVTLLFAQAASAQVAPAYQDAAGNRYTAQGTFCVPSVSAGCPGNNGSGGATFTDPNGASYLFAPSGGQSEGSSAASYTFTNTAQRGWYATCPAGTIGVTGSATAAGVLVTFTGPNGGTKAFYLQDGNNGPYNERIVSFSGNAVQGTNPAACYIGLEF